MKTDLVYYIILLLHKEGKVRIPGLGSISLLRRSAMPDQDRDLIHPPTNSLDFTASSKRKGRVLAAFIAYKTGIDEHEVRTLLGHFSTSIRSRLENENSFPIENLGVFVLRNGEIFFEPDDQIVDVQFNGLLPVPVPESFVTPGDESTGSETATPVTHDHVAAPAEPPGTIPDTGPGSDAFIEGDFIDEADESRPESSAPTAQAPPAETGDAAATPATEPDDRRPTRGRSIFPIIIPLALAIFVMTSVLAYLQYKSRTSMMYPVEAYNRSPIGDTAYSSDEIKRQEQQDNPDQDTGMDPEESTEEEILSQPGSGPQDDATGQVPGEYQQPESETEPQPESQPESQPEPDTGGQVDTPLSEESPHEQFDGTGMCYVVVGAFGVKANADRMIERLAGLGYTAIGRPVGNLTQIGVPAECNSGEITEMLRFLQDHVEADAWISTPDH